MTMRARSVDALLAEHAVAALGLRSILEGKPRWNLEAIGRAGGLATTAKRLISGFLQRPEPADPEPQPEFDYDEARDLILRPKSQENEALIEALGPELGMAVGDEAARMMGLLRSLQPTRSRQTLTGEELLPPTDQEVARFRRAWEVANDPMIALRDLQENALSRDQAEALRMLFPSFAKTLPGIVRDVLTAIQSRRPYWKPSRDKEQQIRVLLGLPSVDDGLLTEIQAMYGAEETQQQRGQQVRKKVELGAEAQQTAGQQAEQLNK